MTQVATLTGLSAVPTSDSSINLTWSYGTDDDPATPQSLVLTLSDTTGRQYFRQEDLVATSYPVPGLSPGTAYVFVLSLVYDDGFSSQVEVRSQTAPRPTPAPTHTPAPTQTPTPTHTPTPTPGPTAAPVLYQYAGLTAVSSRTRFGASGTSFALGYVCDANQHVQMIVRAKGQAWQAPIVLDGVFIQPTTPGAVFAEVDSGGNEFGNVIACALGTDVACYVLENPKYQKTYSLGGGFQSSPLLTSWSGGRVDVFAQSNTNLHIYQKTMDGNLHWSANWNDLGYAYSGFAPVAAVACAADLIDIVGTDTSDRVFMLSYDGHQWSTFDPGFTAGVGGGVRLVSSAPGRLDLLAIGQDLGLYHRSRSGGSWSGWELVGAKASTWAAPAVASWGSGRLDVVCVGADESFYHKSFDGHAWSPAGAGNWTRIGGGTVWGVGPALAAPDVNWLELFVKGTNKHLYTVTYDGKAWGSWTDHGIALA